SRPEARVLARARRQASAMPRSPLLALLALFPGACFGPRTGYERASATAAETSTYREDLVRLHAQLGLTAGSLRTLVENPNVAPRSNRATFETFAREVENLSDLGAEVRKSYGRVDARAESFFARWTEDTAVIEAADLKQHAGERRAALQANYE